MLLRVLPCLLVLTTVVADESTLARDQNFLVVRGMFPGGRTRTSASADWHLGRRKTHATGSVMAGDPAAVLRRYEADFPEHRQRP